MKSVIVLGATGMLGHKVCQELVERGHRVVGVLRGEVRSMRRFAPIFESVELVGGIDVLDAAVLEREIVRQSPDYVVNAVGLVKQRREAADPYLAVAINALLPHLLSRICHASGARLVHVSTDCVFDGRRGGYRETDFRDADDLYGRSKALGETTDSQTSAVTLRTSFIGRELKSPRHGLLEWFLSSEGQRVRGFAGALYTGLTSRELARAIRLVVEGEESLRGLYHVASEPITKCDLLELIRTVYKLDVEIERVEQPMMDRSLLMGPFSEVTGYRAPSWEEMVRDMFSDPTPYDELAKVPGAERKARA